MRDEYESITWDDQQSRLTITKQEHIDIKDAVSIDDVKSKFRQRLSEIVQEVKGLKTEADKIKSLLGMLEEKAEPIGPDPDPEIVRSQSSPAG